jgi:hypothetical protein
VPPRLKSFALGFAFGEPWGGFYAIGSRDGFDAHLKEAPKNPADPDGYILSFGGTTAGGPSTAAQGGSS